MLTFVLKFKNWYNSFHIFAVLLVIIYVMIELNTVYGSLTVNHAYQSLACETAINTEFSELFSLKRIYAKYKNAILSLIDCFFRT